VGGGRVKGVDGVVGDWNKSGLEWSMARVCKVGWRGASQPSPGRRPLHESANTRDCTPG
jgi:hypothetical protein